MAAPSRAWIVAVVIAAAVVAVQARVVVGAATWDDVHFHTAVAPPREAAAVAIGRGELPEWWEGSSLGVPLAAEPSHAALDPATWLGRTPHALELVLIAHLWWAGLGVALWARRRGASARAAAVAGCIAAACGVVAATALGGSLPALAHLPWIGWAAAGLAEGRRRSAAALASLIGAIALAGELAVLGDALVLACAVGASRASWRWLAGALAAGLALGAALWLPALHELASTAGSHVAPLSLARLAVLVAPLVPLIVLGELPPRRRRRQEAREAEPGSSARAARHDRLSAWRLLRRLRRLGGYLVLLASAVAAGRWHELGQPETQVAALALIAAAMAARGLDAAFARRWLAIVALALAVMPVFVQQPAVVSADALAEPAWASAVQALPAPRRLYRPPQLVGREPLPLADAFATLAGASAARWGVDAARSDDPARASLHDATWFAAGHEGDALLDRFGIALAVLPASNDGSTRPGELGRSAGWTLVQMPAVAPAAVYSDWEFVPDVHAAIARTFPPVGARAGRERVVLVGQGIANEEGLAPPRACTIERWTAGAIDLTCTAQLASFAVVSSSAAPGWSVTVDDRGAPWLVADALRRAVALPPGTHHVAWRYREPGLHAGLALAVLGALAVIALLVLARRYSPPQT
jgi:hypothetical protein